MFDETMAMFSFATRTDMFEAMQIKVGGPAAPPTFKIQDWLDDLRPEHDVPGMRG